MELRVISETFPFFRNVALTFPFKKHPAFFVFSVSFHKYDWDSGSRNAILITS